MDVGLLLLRLFIGALLAGHALQKLTGAFGGAGPARTGALFASWGHRPGTAMAVVAGLSEAAGATLLVLGLGTPLASAAVVGTMTVAALALANNGLWAVRGGSEVPLLYAIAAAVLGFTGPGAYSLDDALGLTRFSGVAWGASALGLGLLAGLPVAARAHRLRHVDLPSPS
ncbi:DoxX family protein [Streptomyces sp. NPDC060205]|uniref:DoxX family protein n=1 Tax=Streptomyces sp. NPDC060205 TaxID=3347072 RepID=UPI00365833DD